VLAYLNKLIPKLVEELTPKLLPLTAVHTVLNGLLAEQIPIRDLRTIVGALIDGAATTQEPRILLESSGGSSAVISCRPCSARSKS
jgi:flagellar biosynthesis protein FlhA